MNNERILFQVFEPKTLELMSFATGPAEQAEELALAALERYENSHEPKTALHRYTPEEPNKSVSYGTPTVRIYARQSWFKVYDHVEFTDPDHPIRECGLDAVKDYRR